MDSFIKKLLGECPIEFIALDEKLRIVRMSDGAAALSDDPSRVIVGADIRESFPEFIGIENDLFLIAQTKLGEWNVRNLSRVYRNESKFTLDISVQPAVAGTQETLIVLIEDVSERSLLEQKLVQQSNETQLLLNTVAASKKYYEQIIESISDALLVLSSYGTIRTVNATATRLLEFHRGELAGIPFNTLICAGSSLPLEHALREHTIQVRTKSGNEIPVAVSTSFIADDDAAERRVIVLARDLRERQRAEKEIVKLQDEKSYLIEEIAQRNNFSDIVGESAAIRNIFTQIEQVAPTDSTVLLLGETGTGKELLAHAIHNLSTRKSSVLVKVNCAALPAGIVESELFGHEKGAFTGANARRIGRFELADGGTLMLDEVGELPLETQAKLLRVLQEQEFERVGGTQTLRTNVRLIAATNQNLEDAVNDGTFRNDLYFRLNIFPIVVPPLRERREDIPLLAKFFVRKFSQRMNKQITTIDKTTSDALIRYEWPGNVRELAAVIERAVVLSNGTTLKNIELAAASANRVRRHAASKLEDVEREHILATLREVDSVIEGPKGAAVRLGMNPSTLRSRMRKLGIRRQGRSYH